MAAPEEDFINTFYRSIGDLHSVRKSLNKEYAAGLKEILQRAAEDISDHTGKFLHTLQNEEPDKDTLQKMITASPSSLNYKNIISEKVFPKFVWPSRQKAHNSKYLYTKR